MAPSVSKSSDPPYRQMELNPQMADGLQHSPANVTLQVEAAQRQIEMLEQRQRELDAQKRELEEINEQKQEFSEHLNRVGLQLHNCVRRMEKELESIQREQEDIVQTCQCFRMHIQVLSALQPKNWSKDGLRERLQESRPKLERAENDYAEAFAHGSQFRHTAVFRNMGSSPLALTAGNLGRQFLQGLAFHLPLVCLLLAAWGVYSLLH